MDLPTRKVEALLIYLARRPDRQHDRQTIRDLLWPDSGKAQAQASLRQALLSLRKALSAFAPDALQVTEKTIALEPARWEVDVVLVESHVADGTFEALERVVPLSQGPFLEGFVSGEAPFDDWVATERATLLGLTVAGLEKLAALQAEAGQAGRAIETSLHSFRLNPLRECAHRTLMRLYAAHGRRAEAAQQYEMCVSTLHRELGVDPDAQTTRLYREIVQPPRIVDSARSAPETRAALGAFVGRDAEMLRLGVALEQAWTGTGRLVLLSGEAGIGKTRLVEALAARAIEQGGVVLRGRGFESEQVLPFAIWVDLLRGERALVDEAMQRMSPTGRAQLARLVPLSAESSPVDPRSNDARPLFDGIAELLSRVADRAPVLVALEDLHWADGMSVRLISFLARRVGPSSRVCLTATIRAEELGGSALLRTVLREVDGANGPLEIEVGPLSRTDTLALAQSLVTENPEATHASAFEQIWAISEGNPLVVVEAMRDLARGAIAPSVARLPVPMRVREIVATYVARLDRSAQEVLATAAAIGRPFDFPLLVRACGSTDRALAAISEDLVRARLLVARGDGLDFTHDRIREVVYDSLLPARRRVLHGAIGRALEALYFDRLDEMSGPIGYQFARAGLPTESVRYLLRFASRARGIGLEEALAALEEARRQTAALPDEERDRAEVETAVRRAECLLFSERVLEMVPTLAPHRRTVEGMNAPVLTTRFHAMAAFAHSFDGDRRRREEHAVRLLAVAEARHDESAAGLAFSHLSLDATRTGQFERGIAQGVEAVARLEASNDPEQTAFGWFHLGSNYLSAGDCLRALDALERARDLADRSGHASIQALACAMLGAVLAIGNGEFEAAVASSKRAVTIAPDPHSLFYAHWSLVSVAALARQLEGNVASASLEDEAFRTSVAALESHADRSCDSAPQLWVGLAMSALAEVQLARGNYEHALHYAEHALAALLPQGPTTVMNVLRQLGRAELGLGRLDESHDHLSEARRVAESVGARLETAFAVFIFAEWARARSDHVAAARYLGEAYGMFDALGLPFWKTKVTQIAIEHAIAI